MKKKEKEVLIGLGVTAIGAGALYFLLREKEPVTPPEEYPVTVSRGDYSFMAHNLNEEIQLKEFLGIEPVGDDIDTYLSALDNAGLLEWKTYWDGKFLNFIEKNTLMDFVQSKYNQYYEEEPVPDYPKTISRDPYNFIANNEYEEIQLKEFLGIEPVGDDIDTYLSALDNAGLLQWKNYWIGIFGNINRTDLVNFVNQKYNEYYEEVPTTGILSLTSTPTGAKIYLNGIYKDTTPVDLTVQANTSYTVECSKEGYITSAVGLNVGAGLTKSYHFTLTIDVCTPNWSCGSWSPDPSLYYEDELITQTRTCTDLNGCEPSYEDSRQVYGTMPRSPPFIDASIRTSYFRLINPQGTHDYGDSGCLVTNVDDTVYIKFRIKNEGNVRHTFYADSWVVAPTGWTTYCRDYYFPPNTPKAVTLDPGQTSDDITFIEKVQSAAPAGTHKFYVSVAEDEPVNELGSRLDTENICIVFNIF